MTKQIAPKPWWAVISSDELLDYLRQAHAGDDPSEVLMRLYLDADERENVRPTEEDEDLDQEREYRRQVEDDNKRLRAALAEVFAAETWDEIKALERAIDTEEGAA